MNFIIKFKFISPVLVLSLVLFAFPAKTNAAPTIESFTTTGTTQWVVPAHVTSVDYLVVAGGGGGGANGGGGGGAGGFRTGILSVTPGASLTVTVGTGGAGGTGSSGGTGVTGNNSVFDSITSTGGGGGGILNSGSGTGVDGANGGSGGGGSQEPTSGGTGTSGQGNNGGTGATQNAGGGGGASAVGANAVGSVAAGNGGAGTASSISGSSVTYAGGGGGGTHVGTIGSGGAGGGGNGAAFNAGTGVAGTANRGGGGGGGGSNAGTGGAGGSGIVILSYTGGIKITGNVQFKGALAITGALSKGSGTFVIDHPLDPRNKLLYHSFVESPDVINIYDGIAKLDKNGEAEIKLPSYFMALNYDFQYEFSALGRAMPNLYIKSEIKNNKFTISGGKSRGRISWQVTGIRHDPYILANPIIVEVEKSAGQLVKKGEYLFPEAYNNIK